MINPSIRAIYYINLLKNKDVRGFLINDLEAAEVFYNIGFARSGTMAPKIICRTIVKDLISRKDKE